MGFWQSLTRIFRPSSVAGLMETPDWANFFTPRQYRLFHGLIDDHFRSQGKQYELRLDGTVHVPAQGEEDECSYGLLNVAQMCLQAPEGEWRSVVTSHFGCMVRGAKEQNLLEENVKDFDKVREFIAVRLWPKSFLSSIDTDEHLYREDLEDVLSVLVFDLPSAIRTVTRSNLEPWGKTEEELFAIGLDNVAENCIPNKHEQEVSDGVALHLLADDSFFVATHALLFDKHPNFQGSHGTLVSIPHRHALLAYPIEDLRVAKALHAMIVITNGMEKEGPGSIAPHVYWRTPDAQFHRIPYELKPDGVHVTPPQEFVEMMEELEEE